MLTVEEQRAKRAAMAAAIRADLEERRGYSVGMQANSHVVAYWRFRVVSAGGDIGDIASPFMGQFIHAAIEAGNLPAERRGMRPFR